MRQEKLNNATNDLSSPRGWVETAGVPSVVGLAAVGAVPGCHQNEPALVEPEHAREKQRGKGPEWLARR